MNMSESSIECRRLPALGNIDNSYFFSFQVRPICSKFCTPDANLLFSVQFCFSSDRMVF